MAATADTVEDLVDEDPSMAGALQAVLNAAEETEDGELEWSDVSDDLTSGQWGRLIEKGVLVEGEDGFRPADRDEIEAALDDTTGATTTTAQAGTDDEDDDGGWSMLDKLVAVAAVGMVLGYNVTPIRNGIGGAVDLAFGPLANMLPFYVLILLAAIVSGVISTFVQSEMGNMSGMQQNQEKFEELQERRKEAKERGDDEALEEINQEQMEMMAEQFGSMGQMIKPMVWTMALSIPFFLWIFWMITSGSPTPSEMVLPMIGSRGWNAGTPVLFPTWILWYFLCSLAFSQLVRKALHIETTPT